MKVLLTGAGGFVGSHVLDHLLVNTDWEIHGIASWRHKGVPERITDSIHYQEHKDRVTIHTHDLTAPLSQELKQRIGKIDYVLNVASESHVDRSIADPVAFVMNNVQLMLNMLEYIQEVGCKHFIHISTDEVYGAAPKGYKHKEWDTILPSNPYSASKAAQEAIAFSYWRTYGLPITITNTMNIIGQRQDPEKFVPMVMQKVANDEPVTIHGTEEAIGSRYYLHARNQADALLFILNNVEPLLYGADVDRPHRFHIVGEKEVNNLDMAFMIAEFMGKKLEYELVDFHSTRPGHDLRYALDGTRLAHFGWTPPLSLEESLKQTIEWTKEHPEWLANTTSK